MGHLKFSIKMLKREYKKSIVYALTLSLVIAITFLFFNIMDNSYLLGRSEDSVYWYGYIEVPFSTTLSFLIVIFCVFMIMFANNFYISRKTNEIAIMTMSGSHFIDITLYLCYQNLVLTLFSFVIGMVLGAGLSIGVNQIIYTSMHYQAPFFYLPIKAVFDTIICVVVIIFAQIVYTSGFVYRKDIAFLLSQEKANTFEDKRILKFPSITYIILYVFGFYVLLTNYNPISAIFPCFIGTIGIGGMIKYQFPKLFHILKQKRWLADKKKLISISHLYYSLRRACMLITLYAVSSSVMIALMIMEKGSPREFMTAMIGFLVVVFLLLASILYKYVMEATTRKYALYNLYKIGYSYQQLKSILKQEVAYFYGFVVGLPLIYIIIALWQAYTHQDIELIYVGIVIAIQIIFGIVAAILTYISYKKNVLIVLEEGVHCE